MNQAQKTPNWKINEQGFTMVELLVGSAISLILLALVAGIIQSQSDTFSHQSRLAQEQANSRAVLDLFSRSLPNAGFGVRNGERLLAASDHYITIVGDQNGNDRIQNNEVVTYALFNPDASATNTFDISPFFDADGDGRVEDTEMRAYSITLEPSSADNLYHIIPRGSAGGVSQEIAVRNIDSLVIRYWDEDGCSLPRPDEDTCDNQDPPLLIPPYVIPPEQLNDIRRVEVEVGSAISSTDGEPETLKADFFLKKRDTAPGEIIMEADLDTISCPDSTSSITATLSGGDGSLIENAIVTFNTSDSVTTSLGHSTTDSMGQVTTVLTYDWKEPGFTATVSAGTIIDVAGENHVVSSAIPVYFGGIFTDNFDDGNSDGWIERTGADNWSITPSTSSSTAGKEYKFEPDGSGLLGLFLNGCYEWQNYEAQVDIKMTSSSSVAAADDTVGLIVRYQGLGQYYSATLYGNPTDSTTHRLVLERYDSGTPTPLIGGSIDVVVGNNVFYTLKTSIDGDKFKAKFWKTYGDEPLSRADEPTIWAIDATDMSYTSGKIGLSAQTQTTTVFFNNVTVTNPVR